MKVERWQKIRELYEAALKYSPERRALFLDENCDGDDELRREVESLLSFSDNSTSFLERPAVAEVADLIINQKFAAGQKLGHYKIVKPLGAGGMGEVYLAEDTRLERKVAIKFLAEEFSQNPDRLRRFVLEAKSASALNHPNIITIYEIGEFGGANFIAMELVEGESLRHLIESRRMKLDEALNAAIQTASALAAAHAAGIIHRDIKPENIMRRPDGLIKVLDFGLAKQTISAHGTGEIDTEAMTRERLSTMPGMVMGTAAYMSPEQVRGRKVDARTDIWSLGVLLYELITGRVPFTGETNSDTLAAILKTEPSPLSVYVPGVPKQLERIVKKALGKDCEERYQVVKDLLLDLKILQGELNTAAPPNGLNAFPTAAETPKQTQIEAPPRQTGNFFQNRRWLWLIAALILPAILLAWYWRRPNQALETNFSASLTSLQITSWKSELSELDASRARISPDGKLIAYVASKNGVNAIWLKQIGGGIPFMRSQEEASEKSPLWSPDGAQIAYISERGGRRGIWTAPALGGAPVLLVPLEVRSQGLVHWSKDGATIYFEMKQNLHALDIASKQITKLTNFDETRSLDRGFSFSPDETRIVYADRTDGQKDLWTADLNGENPSRLTNDAAEDSKPIWYKDGERVIYNSNRNGIKQICLAFPDGRPPVQLTFSDSDSNVYDVSTDGTKILYAAMKDESDLWGVRLDSGKEFQLTSDIGVEFWQDAAPNGETIAFQSAHQSSAGDKLFHCLLLSQKITGDARQTQLADDGFNPRWSPDGNQLAFLRSAAGNNSLWVTSAAGGDARALTDGGIFFGGHTELPYNRMQTQDYQWSADSRSLIYCAVRGGVSNVWQTATDGTGEKQLTNNDDKGLLFFNPVLSPDGGRTAWLALSMSQPKKPSWSIWILADGKASRIYQSESLLSPLGWSPSGKELIIKSVPGAGVATPFPVEISLLQINLETGGTQDIARLKAAYFQNVALSPDRKTLAFVARADGSDAIQILPATGGAAAAKTLISSNDTRVYFSSLAFAPDGKALYYGKQSNWQIISMINNFK